MKLSKHYTNKIIEDYTLCVKFINTKQFSYKNFSSIIQNNTFFLYDIFGTDILLNEFYNSWDDAIENILQRKLKQK